MTGVSWLLLVEILGAVQGLFLAVVLFSSSGARRSANQWLAGFVAAFALLTAGDALEQSGAVLTYPRLAYIFDWLIFLLGPLMLFYVRLLTGGAGPSWQALLLHGLPAALAVLVLLLTYHLLPDAEQRRAVEADLISPGSRLDPVMLLAAAQTMAYWLASLVALRRYGEALKQRYSALERRNFRWLVTLLRFNLMLWALWIIALFSFSSLVGLFNSLGFPVGIYVLGYLGLRQPDVFREHSDRDTEPAIVQYPPTPMSVATAPLDEIAKEKYAKSGLTAERADDLRVRLAHLMDTEKPFLENDLTLSELAQRLGGSPHHLSQLLNNSLGQTFFDYINARRVEEVKRCLGDPAYAHQPLLEVAFGAGFNSKAAFNAAFKKHTGITPTAYRKSD